MVRIMKKNICIALLFFAPCFAQGQVTEQVVNEMGKNGERYRAVQPFEKTDWTIFAGQPRYNPATPEMLNGYQKSTAGERGISEVWNEVGDGVAVKVALAPNEVVLYSGDSYYLDNCRWFIGGKWTEFKNRIKPISPPPPPVAVVPPPPPPPAEVEVSLPPPPETVELVELPPQPDEWQPQQVAVTLVWEEKNGRPLWSKFPVLNCGYQLIPGLGGFKRHGAWDIVEKVGCGVAIGFGISAAVGGGGVAAAVKIGACVPFTGANGITIPCAH